MAKVNDIVVETDGTCFLCSLKISTQTPQVKLENGGGLESESANLHSLQLLSRYLRLDMRKVFDDKGQIPPSLLSMIEKSNLKVELCEGCASITDNFSKGYHQLKQIELELVSYVNLIQERLMKCEENSQPYQFNQLASSSLISIMGLLEKQRIVKVLRTETMEKCSQKLSTSSPRVELKNLRAKNVDSVRTKLKFNSTDNSPLDGEASQSESLNSKVTDVAEATVLVESCTTLNSEDTGSQPEPTMETVGLSIELGEVKLHPEFEPPQQITDIEESQPKCPKSRGNDSEPVLDKILGNVKVDQDQLSISQNDKIDPLEDVDNDNEDITQAARVPAPVLILNCNQVSPRKRKTRSDGMSPNKRICKTNLVDGKGTFEVSSESESTGLLVGPVESEHYIKDPETGLMKCSICSLTFTASGFNYHYKSIHLKMRFKCNICKKEFQHQRSYKRHYDSRHLGVTYKCEYCDKVCSLKSNLIKHEQGVHLGKRFQCPICSKFFFGSTRRHMRICPMKNSDKKDKTN